MLQLTSLCLSHFFFLSFFPSLFLFPCCRIARQTLTSPTLPTPMTWLFIISSLRQNQGFSVGTTLLGRANMECCKPSSQSIRRPRNDFSWKSVYRSVQNCTERPKPVVFRRFIHPISSKLIQFNLICSTEQQQIQQLQNTVRGKSHPRMVNAQEPAKNI